MLNNTPATHNQVYELALGEQIIHKFPNRKNRRTKVKLSKAQQGNRGYMTKIKPQIIVKKDENGKRISYKTIFHEESYMKSNSMYGKKTAILDKAINKKGESND